MTMASPHLSLGVPPRDARALCVFVHGRGQSPEAMQENIIRYLRSPDIAYVLPRAPAGSWYAAKAIDPLTDETRRDLAASLELLEDVISDARNKADESVPLVLGGFSQGACLSLEYAMKNGPWTGAMANFTGCRVGIKSDERPFSDLKGMPVYLTGSDADSWIPVHAWAEAAETLGKARARLRTDLIPGRAHEASRGELAAFDAMLGALARDAPLWQGTT